MFCWDDEKVEILKAMWADGTSTKGIGRELGCSRNAVAGKITRLELPTPERKAAPAKPGPVVKEPPRAPGIRVVRPRVPHLVLVAPPAPKPKRRAVTLLKMTDCHCRWPIGDPSQPDFRFYGAPQASLSTGQPYCPEHHKVAYRAFRAYGGQAAE
jgi:GcrA cell cycle regulator